MSRLVVIISIFIALMWNSSAAQEQPQVFAPGVVSGGAVFGVAFTPDGKTVYFCETDPEIKHIQIMESRQVKGKWSKPVAAVFSPGPYRDIDPFVTPDGKQLFFNSNRPPDGKGEALKTFDIYVMDRLQNGTWSEPRRIDDVNSDANEVFATAALNGDLYFGSDRPGGKGKMDIYVAKKTAKGYEQPKGLDDINTPEVESNPLIAPDESYLIFARSVNEHMDLFISYHNGDHWSPPESLGPLVDTDDDEYAPAFSPDHKLLYFTRTRFENNKRVKPGMIYSVRISDLKLGKTARSTDPIDKRCVSKEHRDFDFMLGEWRTLEISNTGTFVGHHTVRSILNGCALREHRTVEKDGKAVLEVDVTLTYDEPNKRWMMVYIDQRSLLHVYEGRKADETWFFYRDSTDDAGKTVVVKLAFVPSISGLSQIREDSFDGGKMWEGRTVTQYERERK